MSDPTESAEFVPVYISFSTLDNMGERMRLEGIPSRIDRSYLGSWSGSSQKQFMRGGRSLGFLDAENRPTALFVEYIKQPDERPRIMAQILRERYGDILALGENATQQQLEEAFRAYPGISGATVAKAISFFLAAANFAGIKLSPHYKRRTPSPSPSPSGNSTPRRRRPKSATLPPPDPPADPPPAVGLDALKTRYVELLLDKLGANDGAFDAELADRIERLMGFPHPTSETPTSEKR